MKKGILRGLCTALIALGLIGYVGYHILRGNQANYITSMAIETVYTDTISAPCWFIRSEQLLETTQTGYLRYAASEGEKVTSGGVVAQVFERESSITDRKEIESLQNQLDNLQSLSAQALEGTKPSTVTEKISEQMVQMMVGINQRKLTELTETSEKIRYYFCEKQIITGEMTDFSEQIADLQAQIETLRKSSAAPIGTVNAPSAGYFSANADGYESVLSPDTMGSLTAEDLRNLQPETLSSNAIGKITRSSSWYAACILPAAEARLLTVGDTMRITLPDSSEQVTVRLQQLNSNGLDGDAVVIFSGSTMDHALASVRSGTILIERSRYQGLQVNRNAVHIEKRSRTVQDEDGKSHTEQVEVQGVYVIFGEQIRFREISPIYWGEDIVICDSTATRTADVAMLKQYDQVISGGRNLYDGKSIV